MNKVLKSAEIIYNYLNIREKILETDTIIGSGCMDKSIIEECARLDKKLHPKHIILSGYKGKGTIGKIRESEASRFKSLGITLGINPEKIILEEHAKTTYQNIKKSIRKVKSNKIVIVHKPYVLKRCFLICQKLNIKCQVTSKDLSFKEFLHKVEKDKTMTKEDVINELVAEVFMIKHNRLFKLKKTKLPPHIIEAYIFLKKNGYTRYII